MPKKTDSTPGAPAAPAGIGVWIGAALVLGMFGMVALMGLLTFYAGLRLLVTGEQHWGVALLVTAMGVVFSGIGLGFFWFQYVKAPVLRTPQSPGGALSQPALDAALGLGGAQGHG